MLRSFVVLGHRHENRTKFLVDLVIVFDPRQIVHQEGLIAPAPT